MVGPDAEPQTLERLLGVAALLWTTARGSTGEVRARAPGESRESRRGDLSAG